MGEKKTAFIRHQSSAKDGACGRCALMLASVASMIELFNSDNIKILSELGYRVDVAANFDSGSVTSQEHVDAYKRKLTENGMKVYHIPIPRELSKISEMWKSYWIIRKLVDKKNYDIVHCHSPIGGVLCRLACINARKRGTKVIYTAHGFHFFKGAGRKAWLVYYPAERFCANFTDVLITINKEDYKAARKFKAGKTIYVPGIGIHVESIQNCIINRKKIRSGFGYQESDFVFMSTGQLSVRKNHEAVIRALGQIKDQRVKYLIAGFGELEEYLRKLVRALELEKRVIFAGYRSDVKELLHAVDAFVLPSIQEGLPVALMEAMAAGLPVVCSRIRGNTELIENGIGGYLADCHSADQFAKAMRRIANMDSCQMGIHNQEAVKKYDSRIVNIRIRDIYETACRI